jgi:hypothetical protein
MFEACLFGEDRLSEAIPTRGESSNMSRHRIGRALIPLIGALSALAIFSSSAFASGAPVVTTGTPDGYILNGATLHGTVNPNGLATTYKIEYGTILPYNKSTSTFTVSGTGEAPVAVSAELLGLNARTTYHYRISATNSSGTTTTADTLLETQADWKVEGARVSEMLAPVKFTDEYKGGAGEGGYIEFLGPIGEGEGWGRIYCQQSGTVSGILGVEITGLTFNNCTAEQGGKPLPNCSPTAPVTLYLNGEFEMYEKTWVESTTSCWWGKKFFLREGAFPVPTSLAGESTKQNMDLRGWAVSAFGLKKWEMVYGSSATKPNAWILSAPNSGKKFGIS